MPGRAWNVFLNNRTEEYGDGSSTTRELIDTVWFDDDCQADYVYRSLVDHDGYDSGIELEPEGLVVCGQCDGVVSDDAEDCPHCGYNLCYQDSSHRLVYDADARQEGLYA